MRDLLGEFLTELVKVDGIFYVAILVNTLEIPEIQKIADRCAVFYHGHIQTILPREEINEELVMLYATNVKQATEE